MQKRRNVERRFEVLEVEMLMEVQGGAGDKEYGLVTSIRNAVLELLGLNKKNDK